MKYLTNFSLVIVVACVLLNANAKGLDAFGSIIKYFAGSDERQSCPQVDCTGKAPCSSNTNCVSPQRCCIDLAQSKACCSNTATPAPPTTAAPATTAPVTSAPASSAAPTSAAPTPAAASTPAAPPPVAFCPDLQPHALCLAAAAGALRQAAPAPNTCTCQFQQDCFDSETCCIGMNGLGCYLKVSPTTTTTRMPGLPCPASVISAPCVDQPPAPAPVRFYYRAAAVTICSDTAPCGSGQICCKKDRALPSCCITYP